MNIRGWGREHRDIKTRVIQYTQCDLISLNETWLKDETETIDIPGCTWFGHNRQFLNKRALKGSGGVVILVANYLFSDFEVFYTNNLMAYWHGGPHAAATIVSMAAAEGERISKFSLMCPNKARCVSFSASDI